MQSQPTDPSDFANSNFVRPDAAHPSGTPHQPVETLLKLAPARGVPLLMPRLGEALEPAQATPEPAPWWRQAGRPAAPVEAPAEVPTEAPRVPRWMPWPLD